MDAARELAERWRRARRAVVLNGAGLSTASGVLTASETPYDGLCHLRSRDPVQERLPAVADLVLAG